MRGIVAIVLAQLICACDNGSGQDDAGVDAEAEADVASDAGGDEPAPDGDDGGGDAGDGCSACHGSDEGPAPPPDLAGSSDPAQPGVGAHAAHLRNAGQHAAVRCGHCHPVPATTEAPGHIDEARPADVAFATLATLGGEARRQGGTCWVYCHGSFLRIAPAASPDWTAAGPLECDGCHGGPPAAPHPPATDCGRCHLDVAGTDGRIIHDSLHIDGLVQAPKGAHLVHLGGAGGTDAPCTACHAGDDYHGPLRDGAFLDTTRICDDCHDPGTMPAEEWRSYEWTPPAE